MLFLMACTLGFAHPLRHVYDCYTFNSDGSFSNNTGFDGVIFEYKVQIEALNGRTLAS